LLYEDLCDAPSGDTTAGGVRLNEMTIISDSNAVRIDGRSPSSIKQISRSSSGYSSPPGIGDGMLSIRNRSILSCLVALLIATGLTAPAASASRACTPHERHEIVAVSHGSRQRSQVRVVEGDQAVRPEA
jgi:hypothetical protein